MHRTSGWDKPKQTSTISLKSKPLTAIEEFTLNTVVSAFVRGLRNELLRRTIITKDASTCGALWKAYDMIQESHCTIALIEQADAKLSEKHGFQNLEKFVKERFRYTAQAVLAEPATKKGTNLAAHLLFHTKSQNPAAALPPVLPPPPNNGNWSQQQNNN